MTQRQLYVVRPDQVDGMPEADSRLFSELVKTWNRKLDRNKLRLTYYRSRNVLEDLGISIPPPLKDVETAVGWPAKAVDALAARSVFDGFTFGGEEDGDLSRILDDNDFAEQYQEAVSSELITSPAFVTVTRGQGDEPEVRTSFYSAVNACALWDWRRRRVRCGFTITDYDETADFGMVPSVLNMYTPEAVYQCVRRRDGRFSCSRMDNPQGVPLMDALCYRPSLDRPFGKSRITRAVMSITDSAVRTALRSEVAAEFFTSPQRYLLGADEETFKEDPDGKKLKMWLGAVQVFTNNEEGEKPTYGQLSAMSMQPHVDYMRSLAARFAGETGIPVSMLGVIHDNPASAEAMYAASEELIIEAEALNRTNGRALRNVARLITAVRRGVTVGELSDDEMAVRPNFKNPMRPSIASTADAMVKIAGMVSGFAGTDVFWEQLGFNEDVRERVQKQMQENRNRQALTAILTGSGQQQAQGQQGQGQQPAPQPRQQERPATQQGGE